MTIINTGKKKLIEVALPLEVINKASAREKSIRHGHPSTLYLWWARRPLAAARAVIFAQMVDDPSSHPDLFPSEKAQEKERQRLFRIIEDLVLWENTTNETVLQRAGDEIWQSWRYTCAENADHPRAKELFDRYRLSAFHDPLAGGGALPLEAQRLGLEAHASDLNPVAVPPVSGDYVKAEGKAGRVGARLMAIVAEGERGRVYLAPTPEMEAIALTAQPTWKPEGDIPTRMTGGNCTPYGLATWGDLFTPRQLVALTTFSDLVQEARERVKRDAIATGLPEDGKGFEQGSRRATSTPTAAGR